MSKQRTLDVEKVNAALKRAAAVAVHGSRDDRAGRFVGRDSASRLTADIAAKLQKKK